jgi:hypothetical protein
VTADVTSPGPLAPSRGAIVRAAALGGAIAALIIVASSGGNVDRMTEGDGLIYRYVASHLATPADEVHPVVVERGTSLRYGRVGMPAVLWVASAGRPAAMPYVQPLLMVLSGAIAAAATAMLLNTAGAGIAVLPYAAPGFPLAIAGGFADAFAIALCLLAVVAVTRARWLAAAVLMSLAILTRENAVFILAALMVWVALHHRWTIAAILASSVLPFVAWSAVVAARYGSAPSLDPYLRDTGTVGPPLVALWRALTQAAAGGALAIAVIHVVVACLAVLLVRSSILGLIAALCAIQVLISGPFAWELIGEATRTAVFLQLFTLMAFVAWLRTRRSPA